MKESWVSTEFDYTKSLRSTDLSWILKILSEKENGLLYKPMVVVM